MSAVPTRKSLFSTKVAIPARLADSVSDEIATALFDGRISPGEPLPSEGEIANDFGVSKPIAREALRQLSAAGLISTQQGKVARAKALNGEPLERIYGYAVRSSLERLREANEMRRVIESGIARLAARRRAPAGLAAMEQALWATWSERLAIPTGFTEADILFHLGLALATGNSMIRVQMEGMRSVQREVSELFSRRANRSEADWQATVDRHRAICDAIAAGDEDLAETEIDAPFRGRRHRLAGGRRQARTATRTATGERRPLLARGATRARHRSQHRHRAGAGARPGGVGADVVLHHLDDHEGAAAVAGAIGAMGRKTAVVAGRLLASRREASHLARDVAQHQGPIDILVANAAIERRRAWDHVSPDHIEAHVAVNFTALLMLLREFVPTMAQRGWGRVVAARQRACRHGRARRRLSMPRSSRRNSPPSARSRAMSPLAASP